MLSGVDPFAASLDVPYTARLIRGMSGALRVTGPGWALTPA